MTTCKHQPRQIGPDYSFTASVAVHPYTDENPAAHGCITHTQECTICGAQRSVNQNQLHYEYGTWGPDRQTRARQERAAAAQAREARERRCLKIARETGVEVLSTNHDGSVNVSSRGGNAQRITVDQITAAAEQPPAGDMLPEIYTGILLMARAKFARHIER